MELETVFRRAAERVQPKFPNSPLSVEDVAQELWTWYLERPSTQKVLEPLSPGRAVAFCAYQARMIHLAAQEEAYTFEGSTLYSVEAVKETLKGLGNHVGIQNLLPVAMERLAERRWLYALAIENRYEHGIIPGNRTEQNRLVRAHEALTKEVNRVYRIDCEEFGSAPGSRHAVFPETRKAQGDYSDPTGSIAIALMDHPEERAAFYEEDSFVSPSRGNPARAVPLNVFDPELNGMPRIDLYRAYVCPDLYPHERL